MKILKFTVIENVVTNTYFRIYTENGVEKPYWVFEINNANKYNTIGSVNYDLKKHQLFFENEFLELKEVKIITKNN